MTAIFYYYIFPEVYYMPLHLLCRGDVTIVCVFSALAYYEPSLGLQIASSIKNRQPY